jgi:cysteine desulfurase / selenocysteine lyase
MTPDFQDLIKNEYHHLDTYYFNTAYFGPSPYSAKQKVSRALHKELDPSYHNYNTWMGVSERVRIQLAGIIDCHPDHIMHSTATSDIINIVANGYDFKDGDVVAAIDKDYPSNILPWMLAEKNGKCKFELLNLKDEVLPTPDWLAKNLPKNTKIFNCSFVTFDTGKKINIQEIGKFLQERDILFCLDVTQGLGGTDITREELSYIDVMACSSYKWILGPYGHAFGYFSEKAQSLITHNTANWIVSPKSKVVSHLLDYTTDTLPGARKYDRGQASNMLAMSCLEAGLEVLTELSLPKIRMHNAEVRDYFLENYPKKKFDLITPTDAMANILSLKASGIDAHQLERELKFRNVDVSVRQGNLRLSFHLFNNKDQVNTLLETIDI